MYSKPIVCKTLDSWTSKGNPTPTYHSRSYIETAIDHLNGLVEVDKANGIVIAKRNPDKRWQETLTREEVEFIRNERVLSRFDFRYWSDNYGWIKNEQDERFRFEFWPSQEILYDIICEMQEWQIAIFLILLKARQLGMSRLVAMILLHRIIFYNNVNAFMASATENSVNLLFDMAEFTIQSLPFWMYIPKSSTFWSDVSGEKFKREGKILELHNNSRITLQHGQQKYGMGRGTTPTVAHISEVSEYDEGRVSDLIESSLLRAMHPSVKSFLALESTAKGIHNYWNDKWDECVDLWPQKKSRIRPLFLPWFVGGLYPKEIELRSRPVPDNYSSIIKPWALNHSKMCREYVLKTDYLLKRLGSNWHMPIEQIWYYECEREAATRRRGGLPKFLQEMPANEDEAFQNTAISVFDPELIAYYRDNAHAQPLVGAFGLKGPREYISSRLEPHMLLVDQERQGRTILCDPGGEMPAVQFELVPLKFTNFTFSDKSDTSVDKIFIWEEPMPGFEYGIGVDTGDGIEKDRTVIEVIRKGGIYGPTKQVAEFASGKMNALDATPFIWALGTYYSVPTLDGERVLQPRLAIECRGHGDWPQNIIRMLGWKNFHPWNDKQMDNKKLNLGQYHKIGVFTNEWFRAGMIEMLTKMIRDGEIEICSPMFVKEMQSLQGDEFTQSLRAAYGGHDDRIMALGFVLVSLCRFDINHFRSNKIKAYKGQPGVAPSTGKVPIAWARRVYSMQNRNDIGPQGSTGLTVSELVQRRKSLTLK